MAPEQEQPREKPIAYDADGNPLYAAPQPQTKQSIFHIRRSHVTAAPESHEGHNFDPRTRVQYANEPRVVHNPRPYEPEVQGVGPELKARHDDSVQKFPDLNLSEGEYVLLSVKRHLIGLYMPLGISISAILLLLAAWVTYPNVADIDPITGQIDSASDQFL